MSYSDDPIVDEVRRVRREHAERHGYDLRRIFESLKQSEQNRGRPLFTGRSKRVKPPQPALNRPERA